MIKSIHFHPWWTTYQTNLYTFGGYDCTNPAYKRWQSTWMLELHLSICDRIFEWTWHRILWFGHWWEWEHTSSWCHFRSSNVSRFFRESDLTLLHSIRPRSSSFYCLAPNHDKWHPEIFRSWFWWGSVVHRCCNSAGWRQWALSKQRFMEHSGLLDIYKFLFRCFDQIRGLLIYWNLYHDDYWISEQIHLLVHNSTVWNRLAILTQSKVPLAWYGRWFFAYIVKTSCHH